MSEFISSGTRQCAWCLKMKPHVTLWGTDVGYICIHCQAVCWYDENEKPLPYNQHLTPEQMRAKFPKKLDDDSFDEALDNFVVNCLKL